ESTRAQLPHPLTRRYVAYATQMATHVGKTTDAVELRLTRVQTPSERAVAQYLLREGPRAAALSAREIAEAVGTSHATVVATAKSLGYRSMRDLRQALSERSAPPDLAGRLRATVAGQPTPHGLLADAVNRQFATLDTLVTQVSPQQFDDATTLLTAASH